VIFFLKMREKLLSACDSDISLPKS